MHAAEVKTSIKLFYEKIQGHSAWLKMICIKSETKQHNAGTPNI